MPTPSEEPDRVKAVVAPVEPALDPSDVTRADVLRQLDEVDEHLAVQASAAAAATQARDRLFEAVHGFAEVARPAELAELGRRLYWTRADLNAEALARALGFANVYQLRQTVGTWPTGRLCGRCGEELRKTSRTGYFAHQVPEYEQSICADCWEQVQRERSEHSARRDAVAHAIAVEPVVGPRRWAYALARIVAQFPPATADVWQGHEEEFWSTYNFAVSVREQLARDPRAEVGVAAAFRLLRAAQGVASWHPREVAAVVSEEVGGYTFADLTEVVEREIELARQRVKAR